MKNTLSDVPLEYISLINDLIKTTCGIMKGVIFLPIQSNPFFSIAPESTVSDIVQYFRDAIRDPEREGHGQQRNNM